MVEGNLTGLDRILKPIRAHLDQRRARIAEEGKAQRLIREQEDKLKREQSKEEQKQRFKNELELPKRFNVFPVPRFARPVEPYEFSYPTEEEIKCGLQAFMEVLGEKDARIVGLMEVPKVDIGNGSSDVQGVITKRQFL